MRGRDQAESARSGRLAEAGIHVLAGPTAQQEPEHVGGTPRHGRAGQHVLADGFHDEAFGREKMAKEVYEFYTKEFSVEDILRVKLPQMSELRYIALNSFLSDERYPPNLRRTLMARIQLERPKLFEQLRQQHEKLFEKAGGDER